jgi:choline dehydrogenase
MRYVTNGNIYAPVMMLAEKAADMIFGKTPLPPPNTSISTATKTKRSNDY